MECDASRGVAFLTSSSMEPSHNPSEDDRTIDPARDATSLPTNAPTNEPGPMRRGLRTRADAFAPGSLVAGRYRIVSLLGCMPLTTHAGEWNAAPGLLAVTIIVLLALACAWRASLASRVASV